MSEMVRLIDITGKAISGEWGNDDETGNGIPVLRTTNFTNDGSINYSSVVTRNIKKKYFADKYLQNGDIIIEKSGGSDKQPVGRVVYFDGEKNKYLFNNFTGLLRVIDKSVCYPKYLFYCLFNNYRKGGTLSFQNKTTGLHNLKTDDFVRSFTFPLPPLPEQHHIAAVLDKVSKLIALRKRQLDLLDEMVKARFVEMFGDPVRNEKGWKIKELKTLTTKIGSGATPKGGRETYCDQGISLIRSMNVHNGRFEYKDLAHITDKQADNLSNVIVEANDILLNITGASVARCCVVEFDVLPARVNQHVCIIRCRKELTPIFLRCVLTDSNYQQLLFDIAGSGATREAITKQQIENLNIILPPMVLQNQFADFVQQVEKSKATVQQGLDRLILLKSALMQAYFG